MSSFEWRVPLSDIDYDAVESAAVLRVLSRRWLTMGPEVENFELAFASMVGVRHAIAVTNATSALHLALLAVGVKPGDEVIQPALNFVAAANMTKSVGAEPIFADIIDATEPTIDPFDIERKVTTQTKAIIVMHYAGYPCRMAEIVSICQAKGIALIEDACHAVGGRYLCATGDVPHGRAVGNLGDIAAFSFFGNKNMVTGEGGMLTTQSDDFARFMRLRRSHGMTTLTLDRHRGRAFAYDVIGYGFNYRPTEIMGALGTAQLTKLPVFNQQRQAVVAYYRERLARTIPSVNVPFADYSPIGAGYHIFPVGLPSDAVRSDVMQAMKERRIETSIHYRAVHTFSAYTSSSAPKLPITEEFCQRTMTLPLYPKMTTADVDCVCDALAEALQTTSR